MHSFPSAPPGHRHLITPTIFHFARIFLFRVARCSITHANSIAEPPAGEVCELPQVSLQRLLPRDRRQLAAAWQTREGRSHLKKVRANAADPLRDQVRSRHTTSARLLPALAPPPFSGLWSQGGGRRRRRQQSRRAVNCCTGRLRVLHHRGEISV
jgi:hypothetical protein